MKGTLQLGGCRYLPVTYCSRECLASGASDGCVMAASVTSPHTEIDTTSMPPGMILFKKNIFIIINSGNNVHSLNGVAYVTN